jgi:codanin-1
VTTVFVCRGLHFLQLQNRDTFYEIVREWEEQCGKPGWCLEEKLGEKIRYIINAIHLAIFSQIIQLLFPFGLRYVIHQKAGLSNQAHFARLFQSQLIQVVKRNSIISVSL